VCDACLHFARRQWVISTRGAGAEPILCRIKFARKKFSPHTPHHLLRWVGLHAWLPAARCSATRTRAKHAHHRASPSAVADGRWCNHRPAARLALCLLTDRRIVWSCLAVCRTHAPMFVAESFTRMSIKELLPGPCLAQFALNRPKQEGLVWAKCNLPPKITCHPRDANQDYFWWDPLISPPPPTRDPHLFLSIRVEG
jgi:hypothetical protein